ncbi:MAG: hypothetical protein IKS97_06685 [Fibrobacter sp.]|nr:hypothetical protein [Fibrobacter sp.]
MRKFAIQHKLLIAFLLLSIFGIIYSIFASNENSPAFILLVQIAVGYVINFIFYITLSFLPEKRKMDIAAVIIGKRISRIVADMRAFSNVMIKQFPSDNQCRAKQVKNATYRFNSDLVLEYAGICLHRSCEETKWTAGDFFYTNAKRVEENIDFILKYYSYGVKPELDEIFDKILHTGVHTALAMMHESNKKFSNDSDEFVKYDELADELERIQRSYE